MSYIFGGLNIRLNFQHIKSKTRKVKKKLKSIV